MVIPKINTLIIVVLAITSGFSSELKAQDSELVVGLYESPPFVFQKDGEWTGMAVDLWENLAASQNLSFKYTVHDTFEELVADTQSGALDVAVTNLTITSHRHERIGFTQPWYDAGLRLIVPTSGATGMAALWNGLRDAGYLYSYAWLILIILAGTFLVTVFDRITNPDYPRKWPEGLAEGFHVVMSIASSGKAPSRKNHFGWPGRIWQSLWLVCGVALLAYITSSVTSVMTTLSLSNQITGIRDMNGRMAGVLKGSTAEDYAKANGMRYTTYDTIATALDAMQDRQVAAVIGDSPVLAYHLHTHPDQNAELVGAIFSPEKYAFGLPKGSELQWSLSIGLVHAQEAGDIEALRLRYFGQPE